MIDKGIGVGISKWASTADIVSSVQEVLDNPKYAANVKKLSQLMKVGMKQKPMDNAIWLLEYLSETKGAEHLKLASRNLNFIQYFSLDFLFIVAGTMLLFVKLMVLLLTYFQRKKIKTD